MTKEALEIVIVGAGGFGAEVGLYVADVARASGGMRLKGFLDDRDVPSPLRDIPFLGRVDAYDFGKSERCFIAIGDPKTREAVTRRVERRGGVFGTLVHTTAYVAPSAKLGPGTILCPFTFVGPEAELAEGVVLNAYASVGHHALVGAFSVLAPYAATTGNTRLGTAVSLGTHSTVVPGRSVGSFSKVAPGSVVMTRDIGEGCLAIGNPARAHRLFVDAQRRASERTVD